VLGQLAGGVGHELRNPLGVISNAVYYLKMVLSDADETTREYLEIISSEVHNAEKIVSDLLDFSRTRPPERKEIAISDLVAQTLEKCLPPEGMQVITEMASDLPAVFVDSRQIRQVLVNLVTNAYQAMPDSGCVTITAELIEGVSIRNPKSEIRIQVSDTGCGIPPKNLEKLFEPLFTTKARGIGLGLAVSKNLVEANGGTIEVESQESKSSTFTVILPTKEAVS
jgi:signal transduction histidine kinase